MLNRKGTPPPITRISDLLSNSEKKLVSSHGR